MNSTETKAPDSVSPIAEVKLVALDPGHFHAALVQKTMYAQVSPLVHVYAPAGPELDYHLQRIAGFNHRPVAPTTWEEKVYTGPDYLRVALEEKAGNVVVLAGNNQRKTGYIKAAVEAGFNVLSDKPMCIDRPGWERLKSVFAIASHNKVLLYDVMTERFEITTLLQKELVNTPVLFGQLQPGTPDNPSVTKESVHYLFKSVAGVPLKRPPWYLDVSQQGEGIVDVSTHLVDLVMWECFPEQPIHYASDVRFHSARRWPTMVSREQFAQVTQLPQFPECLSHQLDSGGVLPYYCNGEMVFSIRGIHAKISVAWDFQAPPGAGDTHFSLMRGSRSSVIIRQGAEQHYRPELYVEPAPGVTLDSCGQRLRQAVEELCNRYPGISVERENMRWHMVLPPSYHVGHEAHFGQVTEKFLGFLSAQELPAWEVPNMITKYFITTRALELAKETT
jgi:predicted dehydrogenase